MIMKQQSACGEGKSKHNNQSDAGEMFVVSLQLWLHQQQLLLHSEPTAKVNQPQENSNLLLHNNQPVVIATAATSPASDKQPLSCHQQCSAVVVVFQHMPYSEQWHKEKSTKCCKQQLNGGNSSCASPWQQMLHCTGSGISNCHHAARAAAKDKYLE